MKMYYLTERTRGSATRRPRPDARDHASTAATAVPADVNPMTTRAPSPRRAPRLAVRRSTHLLLGVAAAAPVAALVRRRGGRLSLPGLIGGAFPDYLDLRSGASPHLKHRGVSHSGTRPRLVSWPSYVVLDAVARASRPDADPAALRPPLGRLLRPRRPLPPAQRRLHPRRHPARCSPSRSAATGSCPALCAAAPTGWLNGSRAWPQWPPRVFALAAFLVLLTPRSDAVGRRWRTTPTRRAPETCTAGES
jgi:hypothetical protein